MEACTNLESQARHTVYLVFVITIPPRIIFFFAQKDGDFP